MSLICVSKCLDRNLFLTGLFNCRWEKLANAGKCCAVLCVAAGVICSAPVFNDWCRAQVVQSYPESDEYDLKLVDYGGYLHLPGTSLRQIRYFITLFLLLKLMSFLTISKLDCKN